MTALLVVLAAALVAGLAWWLVPWRQVVAPAVASARAALSALTGTTPADQPAPLPWVAELYVDPSAPAPNAPPDGGGTVIRQAGDWYDPTVETVPQTFNERGFITSPSPAPVDPKTGRVPLTNADMCSWVGHLYGTNTCARCGLPIT